MAAACDESSNLDDGIPDSGLTDVKNGPICGVCDEKLTAQNAFRCDTCQLFNEANTEEIVFCEFCIAMIHVRKGHEVIDNKGYKPAICQKHRMLSLMFCYDCQVVFCFKCLGPHCSHKYSPVSEKASEVRKEVFECLNSFEELAKPFKRKENKMKQAFDERQRCLNDLDHDKLEETLSKFFINAIKDSAPELAKSTNEALSKLDTQSNTEFLDEAKLNAVCQMSKDADENVIRLRELLLMSEGVAVEKFLQLSDEFNTLIEVKRKELDSFVCLDWCSRWEDIARDCLEKSVTKLQVPKVRSFALLNRQPIESSEFDVNVTDVSVGEFAAQICTIPFFGNCEFIEILDVRKTSEYVHFKVLFHIVMKGRKGIRTRSRSLAHFSLKLSGVVSFYCLQEILYFICDRGTFRFDAFNKTFEEITVAHSNFTPDFSFLFYNDSSFTVYRNLYPPNLNGFNLSTKNLRYSPKQPKLVSGCGEMKAFVEDNIVTIVDTTTKLALQVLPIHHQLQQIDCLVFSFQSWFTLFDYKARILLRCEIGLTSMSSMFWRIASVCKLEIPSDEIVLHCSIVSPEIIVVTDATIYTLLV